MAGLRDLIRFDRSPGIRLPAWFERFISVGIISADPKVIRRQRFTNVVALAAAVNAASHLAINYLHEPTALAPVHMYNALFAAVALFIPFLHRLGDAAAATALAGLILVGNLFAIWMLGRDSQLHVYFTLAGILLFMFGVEYLRLFFVWFAIAFVALLASLYLAPPDGLLVPADTALRDMLASHAMINAIIINGIAIFYALTSLHRAEEELEKQYARSAVLVEAVLPATVADRLILGDEQKIADRVENLSVLFADLVGFTRAAHGVSPEAVVDYLDAFVRELDDLCARHRIEKIKTVGDCYMAAGGLHGAHAEEAVAIGRLALDMLAAQSSRPPLGGERLALRVGIHVGSATAGIIGDRRFTYDVWGDAVNIASRMESHGVPGRIHVSEAYKVTVEGSFEFEPRGETDIKGIGATRTHFLVRAR